MVFGQKLLAARISRPVPLPEALRGRPMPDRRRILGDLRALIEQDWRNVEAGYYAFPHATSAARKAVRRAVDFFADLTAVERGGTATRGANSDRNAARARAIICRNFIFRPTAI